MVTSSLYEISAAGKIIFLNIFLAGKSVLATPMLMSPIYDF